MVVGVVCLMLLAMSAALVLCSCSRLWFKEMLLQPLVAVLELDKQAFESPRLPRSPLDPCTPPPPPPADAGKGST